MKEITLENIRITVDKKAVKRLYLKINPEGDVRISLPWRMKLQDAHDFAFSNLAWIKQQQIKLLEKKQRSQHKYVDSEPHFVWGKSCMLRVVESTRTPYVELKGDELYLYLHKDTSYEKRKALIDTWYRAQLEEELIKLIPHWETKMNVKVTRFFIQKMKTLWGSCNPRTKSVRFNTELAKKSPDCLEYLVVHELAHLLEASHNHRFKAIMDQFLPSWRVYRDLLKY